MTKAPPITPKTSERFNDAVKPLGLHIPGISLSVTLFLAELEACPQPLRVIPTTGGQLKSPSSKPQSLGPSIRHGMAALVVDHYRVTANGTEYLRRLREAGLI